MSVQNRKLITIITEAAIERLLVRDIKQLGAQGYTIVEARGEGSRDRRNAEWAGNRNIRIEVLCEARNTDAIVQHMLDTYHDNYAMIIFILDADIIDPKKF